MQTHVGEPHTGQATAFANRLRAAVLGAGDGIVSTAALIVGVAAANASRGEVLTAGLAGLVAGAGSMAVGEYVSVSSQRDREDVLLDKERRELIEEPESELAELAALYRAKGLSPSTAALVADELTAHDAFGAHVQVELGLDPADRSSPLGASAASAAAFTLGSVLPLVAAMLAGHTWRIPVTVVAVLLALTLTGLLSAACSKAPAARPVARLLVGGAAALAFTYGVGTAFGTAIG